MLVSDGIMYLYHAPLSIEHRKQQWLLCYSRVVVQMPEELSPCIFLIVLGEVLVEMTQLYQLVIGTKIAGTHEVQMTKLYCWRAK